MTNIFSLADDDDHTPSPLVLLHYDQRIYAAVRKLGHASVTAFAESRPTARLAELARQLALQSWGASRIEHLLIREASKRSDILRCSRGLFARVLYDLLPRGWEANLPHAFETTMIGIVMSFLLRYPDQVTTAIDAVRARLRAVQVAVGWRPSGADDPVLVALLSDEWPGPVVLNPRWIPESR